MKTKTKTKEATVCSFLLDKLKKTGLKHIFATPGDHIIQFDKMVEKYPFNLVTSTNQQSCGFMADAYARLNGLSCLFTTYGVGINIVNAITQAYSESSPVIVVSSSSKYSDFYKTHQHQSLFKRKSTNKRDTTQLDIFKKITVYQALIDDPKKAALEIDAAIEKCKLFKKPVYIEIPDDLLESKISHVTTPSFEPPCSEREALDELTREVESMLKNSKKPIIWLGHQIKRYGLTKSILKFAEKFHIPIVTTLLGKTTISEFHPLFLGVYHGELSEPEVKDYVESADMAIILGIKLNDINSKGMVTCLEQDQKIIANTGSIKACNHYYEDVTFFDFIKELGTLELNIRFREKYPARIDRNRAVFQPKKGQQININRFFDCLQKHLDPSCLVVTDIGNCLFGSIDLQLDQDCFVSNSYYSTLGFGVSGAIGAQLAKPEKRVVAVIGDGAFQMSGLELTTCLKYKIDPIVILLNNHGFTTERTLTEGKFNEIANWNYAKICDLICGGTGVHVKKEEELESALSSAFSKRGKFTLIDVNLKKGEFSPALKRLFMG